MSTRATSLGQAQPIMSRGAAKKIGADGGKTAAEMTAEHDAWRDEQPIVTLCGFCDWRFAGTAAEGRAAAAEHRAQEHPDAKPVRRRRGTVSTAHLRDNDKIARAEAMAEAERRRRTTHAEDNGRTALERMDAGLPQEPERELDDGEVGRSSSPSSSAVLEPEAPVSSGRVAGASTNPYGLKRFGRGYIWTKVAHGAERGVFAERERRAPSLSDVKKQPIGTLPSSNSAAVLFGSSRGTYALAGHEEACSEREPQAEASPRTADGSSSTASEQSQTPAAPSRSEDAHLALVAAALDRIADGFRALAQLAAERAVEQREEDLAA